MKRAAVIAFTKTGAALGGRLMNLMKEWETELFVPERIWAEKEKDRKTEGKTEPGEMYASEIQTSEMRPMLPDSHSWLEVNWNRYQGFIFVSAAGIAVRLIAPCLKDKLTDPAVVALDEKARFSIPLASGHVGGANRLAETIAERTGAMPVITTATDVEDKFAVDLFAKRNGIRLRAQDRYAARDISAAILEGKPVEFRCEYEIRGEIPEELTAADKVGRDRPERKKHFSYRIEIGKNDLPEPPEVPGGGEEDGTVLQLIPRDVVLGIGCKKGVSAKQVMEAIQDACMRCRISADRLSAAASIDLKAEEPGIREAAGKLALPFLTYPAEKLSRIWAVSRESEFVRSVTGVGNVCERAAVYCALYGCRDEAGVSGKAAETQKEIEILLPKTIYEGITLAAVRKKWSVRFE